MNLVKNEVSSRIILIIVIFNQTYALRALLNIKWGLNLCSTDKRCMCTCVYGCKYYYIIIIIIIIIIKFIYLFTLIFFNCKGQRSSVIERPLMVQWVFRSILHGATSCSNQCSTNGRGK